MTNLILLIAGFTLINVVAVQGLTVLYGWTDQVSLATGAFFGLGAYVQALTSTSLGWSPWVGVPLAVLAGWTLGALVGLPALRLKGHYLAMGTLAFGALMVLAFTEADAITGGIDGFGNIPYASVPLGDEVAKRIPSVFLLAALAALGSTAFTRNVVRNIPGSCMAAMAASEDGARSCGVQVERISVRAFAYSGAMAALGGALYAMLMGFISPALLGVHTSIAFVAMAVIGGRKSIAGPVVAAAVLTLVQQLHLLLPALDSQLTNALKSIQTEVYAVLIILLVIFAPQGISSLWARLATRTAVGGGGSRGSR